MKLYQNNTLTHFYLTLSRENSDLYSSSIIVPIIIMLDKKITDDLEIFAKKIMENEGITDYNLKIEGQTAKGVNYGSEIVFFSITTNAGKKYNLVMKTTLRAEAMRKAREDGVSDKREMHVYSKVFPCLRQMLSESKSEYQLENVPETFLVITENKRETAIMQDLRSAGYKLCNSKKPMNMEQVHTVLENYGKFHAASMALRVKKPQIFNDLSKDMDNPFKYFVDHEDLINVFRSDAEDALTILGESGLEEVAEKLRFIPVDMVNILAITTDQQDKVVITHGDCWNNNMMFKYHSDDSEGVSPSGVCFLDFQNSTFGSPALDLSYFLYTSLDEKNLLNGIEDFLKLYYESLSTTLINLKVEPKQLLTYQDLQRHWKKYAKYGLAMASLVVKIQLSNSEDAPDLSDVENEKGWSALKVNKMKNNEDYRNRIAAIYQNYANTCLI